ncbi:MAG: glycosyltransferase family 2 protein [Lachnospiraceae bacterium]|nr:glycosyltransferase family 2 protein [Lachnospiraceae bacterium]
MSNFEYNISVIVPTYNTANYLYRCIDSLINQTIKSIEIIIVDDASTETLDEVQAYYSQYLNIKFLKNEERLGAGGARNKGLQTAQGKYISFCDSDDWVDLNLYEKAYNAMEHSGSDIGVFSIKREYDSPIDMPYYPCKYNQFYSLIPDTAFKILLQQYDMGITIPFYCTNKIFRREFLNAISASFEENISYQGKLFSIYTFLYAKKIICIPDVCYRHYRRKNSTIQSFKEKHIDDFKKSMIITKVYLKNANKYDIYKFQYYKLCEKSLDLVIKQIFEFITDDDKKKIYLKKAILAMQELVSLEDYFEYANADEIRKHIQPYISDTTLK